MAKTKRAPKATRKAKPERPAQKKGTKRQRQARPYPASSFKDATALGAAIFKFASGQRVRRLTLLEQMNLSPTSSRTKMLITNSGKYGITEGSYAAEWLELTKAGRDAVDPSSTKRARLRAQFDLAVAGVEPFSALFEEYVGKRLPIHGVMSDFLDSSNIDVPDQQECIDTFIVNVKDLGLLRTISGSETLVSIEQVIDETSEGATTVISSPYTSSNDAPNTRNSSTDWDSVCFYVSPIGDEGSDARKHSDLFMNALIEPAMAELKLTVIRADKIGNPGMITSNILEYIRRSRLVVSDLSMLNPNVFYETALRHSCKMPIVQIIRKRDRLPFDVNQVNTVVIDDTDIYTLVPRLETHRSEIATLARQALENPEHNANPLSVFYPDFWKTTDLQTSRGTKHTSQSEETK